MEHITLSILVFLAVLQAVLTSAAGASGCTNLQCSHECVDANEGSFCQCPEDYFMKDDRRTCAPRLSDPKGTVVFCFTWPNAAQGKIYFPTGADKVLVTFPHAVERIDVRGGNIARQVSGKQYIITQSEINRQESLGIVKFVLLMGSKRYPDYDVTVTPSG